MRYLHAEFSIAELSIANYHLAAHAVIQAQMGRSVFVLDNREDNGTTRCASGEFETAHIDDVNTAAGRMAVLRDCVYQLAGWAVEKMLTPGHGTYFFARGDEERASHIIRFLGLEPSYRANEDSMKYAKAVVQKLIADRDVFYRIQSVAEVLQKRKVLTGGEVWDVLRHADRYVDVRRRLPERFYAPRAIVHPASPRLRIAHLEAIGTTGPELPKLTPKRPRPEPLRRRITRPAPDILGKPLEILGLSSMAFGALKKRGGILTIEQLLTYTPSELRQIRTVGDKTILEVMRALQARGYELRREP